MTLKGLLPQYGQCPRCTERYHWSAIVTRVEQVPQFDFSSLLSSKTGLLSETEQSAPRITPSSASAAVVEDARVTAPVLQPAKKSNSKLSLARTYSGSTGITARQPTPSTHSQIDLTTSSEDAPLVERVRRRMQASQSSPLDP